MGIRFFCPNGHKINVKTHLAGKSGFCPECGARVSIPLQSTRPSSKETDKLQQSGKSSSPQQPNLFGGVPAFSFDNTGDNEADFSKFFDNPNNFVEEQKTVQALPLTPAAQESQKTASVVPAAVPSNPLLKDQSVVWYIQVPGGNQFGPLTGTEVNQWIHEHRLLPAMLIWREGWTNWLEAQNVFPELSI